MAFNWLDASVEAMKAEIERRILNHPAMQAAIAQDRAADQAEDDEIVNGNDGITIGYCALRHGGVIAEGAFKAE
jgi:hypothetical protein